MLGDARDLFAGSADVPSGTGVLLFEDPATTSEISALERPRSPRSPRTLATPARCRSRSGCAVA
ncbi:hypothetical protein [Thermomonospora umbrina]|uniref:hypothetical protein n=1 Tax=Thermomonospora umbrina TaxID=111806 RepID=UPI000E254E13|nr:hypothetical protein [Thermomonospora umbrina]